MKIKYIGKRPTYIDGCYGSNLKFTKGESLDVSDQLGAKLTRHKDQFIKDNEIEHGTGDELAKLITDEVLDGNSEQIEETPKPVETHQEERDAVMNMDKTTLANFAFDNFSGMKLNNKKSVDSLRTQVIGLIDQYGLG